MHSSWLKYCLSLTVFLSIFFLTTAYGQSKIISDDRCVVSFLAGTPNGLKRAFRDEKPPPKELGKIDISGVTEGTEISKTYRIPNSPLHVLVELLFDDDLSRDLGDGKTIPRDAMTLWLTVWHGPKRNSKSVLAVAINQAAFDQYSFRSITTAYAKKGSKIYFVLADCTAHSEKENGNS